MNFLLRLTTMFKHFHLDSGIEDRQIFIAPQSHEFDMKFGKHMLVGAVFFTIRPFAIRIPRSIGITCHTFGFTSTRSHRA